MSQYINSSPKAKNRAFVLLRTFFALAIVGSSVVAITASQPIGAQSNRLSPLNPDLCATAYKPAAGAGDGTEADCRTIVAWHNAVVNHPNSVMGSDHPMALWGTGDQTEFHKWSNLGVYYAGQEHLRVTQINLSAAGLAGPLPGELPHIRHISLDKNLLTGEFPTWLYNAPNLTWLDLRNNLLSGSIIGSAFRTPNLGHFLIQNNNFSGSVPNFNFSNMPQLTDIRISNNNFSGPIPNSWSSLADGRGVQRVQLDLNRISGDLPSWVSNLKFADSPSPEYIAVTPTYPYILGLSHNKLCIPDDFTTPAYNKINGQKANVIVWLSDNRCPTQDYSASPSVLSTESEPVDIAGLPSTNNPTGLKVTWNKPTELTGEILYVITLYLKVPAQENVVYDELGRTNLYCPSFSVYVGPTSAASLETTVTREHCGHQADDRSSFDPTKYNVDIAANITNQQTLSISNDTTLKRLWHAYLATDASKTYRDMSYEILYSQRHKIYIWDIANQVWRAIDRFDSNLEPGTTLAINRKLPLHWLDPAGLSIADEDTPVQLQNGWNIIPAGGSVTREPGENGAFFIDDRLLACNSMLGTLAIFRYNPVTEYDLELPCHPDREAALTRGGRIGRIEDLEQLDILFIYFRSALPVSIRWDDTLKQYIPSFA